MSYQANLTNVLIQDKMAEMRENLLWLEDYGRVESKDIDNLQRLLDTLRKLVELEERASIELGEESEESQGLNC